MPKATKGTYAGRNQKAAYWLPNDLIERVREYVGRHKNHPENMTINGFVREAIGAALDRALAKEKK